MEKKKVSEFGTPIELIPEGWAEEARDGELFIREICSLAGYAIKAVDAEYYLCTVDNEQRSLGTVHETSVLHGWLQYQCAKLAPVQKPAPSNTTGPAIDPDKIEQDRARLDGYMQAVLASCPIEPLAAMKHAIACMSAVDEHLTQGTDK